MKQCNYKIQMDKALYSDDIVILRTVSILNLSPDLIKSTIISNLKAEAQYKFDEAESYEGYRYKTVKDVISGLDESEIIYNVCDEKVVDGSKYYYNQLVLFKEYNGRLINLKENLFGIRDEHCNVSNHCPIEISYELGSMYNHSLMVFNSSNPKITEAHRQISNLLNNLVVSVNIDTSKKYVSSSQRAKVTYKFHNNIKEAIEEKDNNTILEILGNKSLNNLEFYHIEGYADGYKRFIPYYKGKLNVDFYKDMIIIYDGTTGYETLKDKIEEFYELGVRVLTINQYSKYDILFKSSCSVYDDDCFNLDLSYFKKDRVIIRGNPVCYLDGYNMRYNTTVKIRHGKKSYKMFPIRIDKVRDKFFGKFIIPVEEKSSDPEAIDKIINIMRIRKLASKDDAAVNMSEYRKLCNDYVKSLTKRNTAPDSISEWFNNCIVSTKSNDEQIIRAYENMKDGLLKEKNELELYASNNDYSKCKPIPRILADEKIIKNYYNTIHLLPKNVIINKIKNENIQEIRRIVPSIQMIVDIDRVKEEKLFGELPLDTFLKNKGTELQLYYKNMRGELIDAKIKNRR